MNPRVANNVSAPTGLEIEKEFDSLCQVSDGEKVNFGAKEYHHVDNK